MSVAPHKKEVGRNSLELCWEVHYVADSRCNNALLTFAEGPLKIEIELGLAFGKRQDVQLPASVASNRKRTKQKDDPTSLCLFHYYSYYCAPKVALRSFSGPVPFHELASARFLL
ncbi:MAG: hypothetical protein GY820_15640, partial [Gammaproteobacteria bacterium]|nr:hypothetical protein [Gammaproteobacteria bacterium]